MATELLAQRIHRAPFTLLCLEEHKASELLRGFDRVSKREVDALHDEEMLHNHGSRTTVVCGGRHGGLGQVNEDVLKQFWDGAHLGSGTAGHGDDFANTG